MPAIILHQTMVADCPSQSPKRVPRKDWDCPNPACSNVNYASRSVCFKCQTPKPMSVPPVAKSAWTEHCATVTESFWAQKLPTPGSTDWICPNFECANKNYPHRNSCNRCGTARPRPRGAGAGPAQQIGESMARNSKGLFSAEDWQCMMCSNINWARRDTCNQCGHPKEGKSEERHGVGGGFKENDNVQYRTRTNDEDQEYDKFGRKRRRKDRRSDELNIPRASPPPERAWKPEVAKDNGDDDKDDTSKYDLFGAEDEDDEDEEDTSKYDLFGAEDEEDGDDGDTSKYDLFGDDDDQNNLNAPGNAASSGLKSDAASSKQ